MPTLEQNQLELARQHAGLAVIVGLAGLAVLVLIVLWRRSLSFRRAGILIAPYLGWGLLLPINPAVALAAALGTLASWIKRPKLTPELVIVFALIPRLFLIGDSFWYDEAFTQRLTTLNLSQLFPAIQADTHPPVYYSFMWLWSRLFGSSELALRLPSLIFGLVMVWLMHRLGLALGLSRRVALIAALLVAITPSAIYYSTEARSYAMLTCAVFGAIISILEDRPRAFVLCTVMVAWLHNLGLLYVPVLCLAALVENLRWSQVFVISDVAGLDPNKWVWAKPVRRIRRRWLIAVCIAVVLSLVWLPLIVQQSGHISNGFWITFDPATPFTFFSLNAMYIPREFVLPILLPTIGLILFGFYASRSWLRRSPGNLLILLIVAVPALAVIVSLLWAPIFLSRLFLPLTLLSLIPLAYALDKYGRSFVQLAAPLLVALLVVFLTSEQLLRPDYRAIVNRECRGKTSAMYYTAVDTALTLAPYWSGDSLTWKQGKDRGLTFMADQLPLFNLEEGDISQFAGKTVCVVYLLTPRTLQTERDYVQELRAEYPGDELKIPIHDELEVDVFRLEIPNA